MCTAIGGSGGIGGMVADKVLKASPVAKILKKNDPLESKTVKSVTKNIPMANTLLKASPLLNAARDESLG